MFKWDNLYNRSKYFFKKQLSVAWSTVKLPKNLTQKAEQRAFLDLQRLNIKLSKAYCFHNFIVAFVD